MNLSRHRGLIVLGAFIALGSCAALPAAAQSPTTLIPTAVDTALPIVVNTVKPKPKPLPAGILKFEGFVMNASTAQITVRAVGNDLALQTFALSPNASARMQQTIDKGGYQYGDRVTVIYNSANQVALRVKGKPSKGS